ncbi:MAG: hypothetical protein FWE25_03245 [Lachnospiraceae bacterium]|nr:hypothetical protein [Lachnospiraceae bacterium]
MSNANHACDACRQIAENLPDFIVNGVTNAICRSLGNNTGLDPRAGQDNCEALQDLVDCYINGAREELPSVDICDIKEWIDRFLSGLYNLKSAMVCNECGQWSEIQGMGLDNWERAVFIPRPNLPLTVLSQDIRFHRRLGLILFELYIHVDAPILVPASNPFEWGTIDGLPLSTNIALHNLLFLRTVDINTQAVRQHYTAVRDIGGRLTMYSRPAIPIPLTQSTDLHGSRIRVNNVQPLRGVSATSFVEMEESSFF